MGLLGTEDSVFCALFSGNRFQPPSPSLSHKGHIETVAHQRREGIQRQGKKKKAKKVLVQPWGRVASDQISRSVVSDSVTP